MSTKAEQQELVIEYWYRILLNLDLSIADISKLIIEFAKQFEKLDPSNTHHSLGLNENGDILTRLSHPGSSTSSFGTALTVSGHKYHWRIKILKVPSEVRAINIGVVVADSVNPGDFRWLMANGWS